MTRQETSYQRPQDYNLWHRTLPDFCKAQDIDWIEYRINDDNQLEIVAIIETGRWNKTKFVGNQIRLVKQIANKLNIPAYFVEYAINSDYDRNIFRVKNLDNNIVHVMSNKQYSMFIMGL